VATPIGHLDDLTYRAAETLGRVDLIAAEDTRRTRKLTSRLGLKARLVSYQEHNRARVGPRLIRSLAAGKDVALVTDAGTPALSDPGAELVRLAHQAGLEVVPVPGPSALVAALSVAGLPADRFTFAGFAPAKAGARRKFLEDLARRSETLVFFEAPHRLTRCLADMLAVFGPRTAVLGRELTKINEEVRLADLAGLAAWAKGSQVKGEVTLVVAGAEGETGRASVEEVREALAVHRAAGLSASEAAREVARELGLARGEVYRLGLDDKD